MRYGVKPRCEGFAISLSAMPSARRAKLLARASAMLVGDAHETRMLNAASRAERTWLITPATRAAVATAALTPRVAWRRAQLAAELPGVRYVEPLFRGPGLEPDAAHAARLLAPAERPSAARRGGKGLGERAPLPCAAKNARWSVEDVHAPLAWRRPPPAGGARFGASIRIAHPDTGYREHPEIWTDDGSVQRLLAREGHDFEDRDPDARDPPGGSSHGHGTATASVIISSQPDAQQPGVTGVAPLALLVPLRVSDAVVHFSFRNVTEAIYHAVDRADAHVISMSLGGPFYSRALAEAINHAIGRGVIVLAAAGNVWPFVVYPARLTNVIAVAASNCLRQPWRSSGRGRSVDISAPGESVWRALAVYRRGQLQTSVAPGSGTSYAVANVAGACALWLAFHGRGRLLRRYGAQNLAGVFRELLLAQGFRMPRGWDQRRFGVGILDVDRLLAAPLPATAAAKRLAAVRPKTLPLTRRVADYFPDVPLPIMRRYLRACGVRPMPELLESELLFHLGTDASLRSRVRAGARRHRASKTAVRINPFNAMGNCCSAALRAALGS